MCFRCVQGCNLVLADKYEAEVEMKNTMLSKHYFHSKEHPARLKPQNSSQKRASPKQSPKIDWVLELWKQ